MAWNLLFLSLYTWDVERSRCWLGRFEAQNDEKNSEIIKSISRSEELELMVVPWRISEPKIKNEASVCNSLLMGESIKWEFPMISAESTLSNSSKWKAICSILHAPESQYITPNKPYFIPRNVNVYLIFHCRFCMLQSLSLCCTFEDLANWKNVIFFGIND